jgi:hypothetical protein
MTGWLNRLVFGFVFGLTTGPTPAGFEYADDDAMLFGDGRLEIRCRRPGQIPSLARPRWQRAISLGGADHEDFCLVSRLAAPLDCDQRNDLQDTYRFAAQEQGASQHLRQTS